MAVKAFSSRDVTGLMSALLERAGGPVDEEEVEDDWCYEDECMVSQFLFDSQTNPLYHSQPIRFPAWQYCASEVLVRKICTATRICWESLFWQRWGFISGSYSKLNEKVCNFLIKQCVRTNNLCLDWWLRAFPRELIALNLSSCHLSTTVAYKIIGGLYFSCGAYREASFPYLEHLSLQGVGLKDKDMKYLHKLEGLRSLDVSNNINISDAFIPALKGTTLHKSTERSKDSPNWLS